MAAAAGLVSFTGAFVVAWLTQTPTGATREPNRPLFDAGREAPSPTAPGQADPIAGFAAETTKYAMTEKQLKTLIYEVREKIREYEAKLENLKDKEHRLQLVQQSLKKDVESLNDLRVELAAAVARLKQERNKLLKTQVEVAEVEKANLAKIAAAYDTMDSTSASKILTNMCTGQTSANATGKQTGNMEDAVKILHYMRERSKAKLLAELVNSKPDLAAILCEKLKRVVEKN
jgi:flagellar motility protein MotE (MotC chaperone)